MRSVCVCCYTIQVKWGNCHILGAHLSNSARLAVLGVGVTHVLFCPSNMFLFRPGIEVHVGAKDVGFTDLRPLQREQSSYWQDMAAARKMVAPSENSAFWRRVDAIAGCRTQTMWTDNHEGQFFPIALLSHLTSYHGYLTGKAPRLAQRPPPSVCVCTQH